MIYLDNSATTALSDIARARLSEGYEKFANPSSLHLAGLEAEKLIAKAREEILLSLGVRSSSHRVIFTSTGTEADNLAIFGTIYAKKARKKQRIITTDSEHPAVLAPLSTLDDSLFEVVKLSTKGGVIDRDEFLSALNEDTLLISIMTVNNETGARYDIEGLFTLAKRRFPDVITHTDAIQAFTKLPFSIPQSKADLVSISGHKIHAPKGVGALIVSEHLIKSKRIVPVTYGGGQQGGFRSGTENVAGIYAFGGAAAAESARSDEFRQRALHLRALLEKALPDYVRINTPSGNYAPHIISLTLPGIRSETMLHFLSSKGIYISSGSACASSVGHSSVLSAFGLSAKEVDSTVRISLSLDTTEDGIIKAAEAITLGCETLVGSQKRSR